MIRIHSGGGAFFLGSLNKLSPYEVFLVSVRSKYINMMVIEKPNRGEMSNETPISEALSQLTAAACESGSNENAMPTPRMEPMSVCELEQGIPRYQVNKFQKMALISSAMTMEILCAM